MKRKTSHEKKNNLFSHEKKSNQKKINLQKNQKNGLSLVEPQEKKKQAFPAAQICSQGKRCKKSNEEDQMIERMQEVVSQSPRHIQIDSIGPKEHAKRSNAPCEKSTWGPLFQANIRNSLHHPKMRR